jgi:putative SOS response-associated peptidase YedK
MLCQMQGLAERCIGRQFAIMAVMCGRYRLSRRKQLVEEYFGAVSEECEWNPRYNIAPSQPVATIRQDAREPVRKLSTMRWGSFPRGQKIQASGIRQSMLGAETVATTASFREPFKSMFTAVLVLIIHNNSFLT